MNNRGQAMIESLLVGMLIVIGISFFLRFAVRAQTDVLVDEFVEQTLICLLEQKNFCTAHLRQLLTEQNYTSISIKTQSTQQTIHLEIKAVSQFGEQVLKESEISNDLSISY